MSFDHLSERLSEAVVRAAGHQDALHLHGELPGGSPRHFSIAISREAGTRGPAVARAVGALLGWQVYDQELLQLVARDLDVRVKVLEAIDERHVPWLLECFEALAAVPKVNEGKYVPRLMDVLLSLAARGRCVIVGRGGPFVLPATTTLRVRLVAPLEERIAVFCREQNLMRSAATRLVEQTDRDRTEFVKRHFQRDPADPLNYDLTINMSELSIDQCARLIVESLRLKSAEPHRSSGAHEDREHAVSDVHAFSGAE
jgi:hypothetical protein